MNAALPSLHAPLCGGFLLQFSCNKPETYRPQGVSLTIACGVWGFGVYSSCNKPLRPCLPRILFALQWSAGEPNDALSSFSCKFTRRVWGFKRHLRVSPGAVCRAGDQQGIQRMSSGAGSGARRIAHHCMRCSGVGSSSEHCGLKQTIAAQQ